MKMEEKNNYTYEAAFKELQEIVQKIEAGDVDIDKLSDYIKRAGTLVKICETKLTETEEEVQILLKKLEKEDEEVEDYDSIEDRKSTRLNSSHVAISYAVFCLKKKI